MELRPLQGSALEWLADRMSKWAGGTTALRMAASAHADGTAEQYGRHWRRFCAWCADVGVEPMPASPQMVSAYIGYLAELGTIAEGSLQPYLSSINSMHADHGLERPACGHLVQRTRQGMRRGQAQRQTRDTRVPRVLTAALHAATQKSYLTPRSYAEWLRRTYCYCLSFVFMGRQDSSVALLATDHGIDDNHIWLRITEKMARSYSTRRVIRLPIDSPAVRGYASALPQLAQLGRLWLDARTALSASAPFMFQLPGEPAPLTRHMSEWVHAVLEEHGIRAPTGFAYLGHSLRSGGSSAAEAIGVSRFRGNWLGGWSQQSNTRELHYIDPSVLPTPEAYSLFGWLLDGHYITSDPTAVALAHARDTADPGELA